MRGRAHSEDKLDRQCPPRCISWDRAASAQRSAYKEGEFDGFGPRMVYATLAWLFQCKRGDIKVGACICLSKLPKAFLGGYCLLSTCSELSITVGHIRDVCMILE